MCAIGRRCVISIFMMIVPLLAFCQSVNDKSIILEKSVISESSIFLKSINNLSGYNVEIIIRNDKGETNSFKINRGEKQALNIECSIIQAIPIGVGTSDAGGGTIWSKSKTALQWSKEHKIPDNTKPVVEEVVQNEVVQDNDNKSVQDVSRVANASKIVKKQIKGDAVIVYFTQNLEGHDGLSTTSIFNEQNDIISHIESIKQRIDSKDYIDNNHLSEYVKTAGKKLDEYRKNIEIMAADFLYEYKDYEIVSDFNCKDSIKHIIEERIEKREVALVKLKSAIDYVDKLSIFDYILKTFDNRTLINIGAAGLVFLILIVWFVVLAKRKKAKRGNSESQTISSDNQSSPAIVVKRKTTSILKKQSLEDVIDNKAYLKIECGDFSNDSAVRRIYLKNTCVKDIYNMYADDLRNPQNPKEDGCMVLGRWVYDDEDGVYYVSLEEIVRPGDDAVFQEYELNFGGKIKLKVAERLRKLRRDTNLQYDLTCWVHSHPGLGVFFSNYDSGVQMQLKHPSHPNFLTAIVIDILTPEQELGIFTFKHDGTINSKNDLKKLYSLEEMYKWAVESDRGSYKPEDYYKILSKAVCVGDHCKAIQLSNGSIIDLSMLVVGSGSGLVGWIHGFHTQSRGQNEYVVQAITNSKVCADNDLLGCLVIGTHCSIPTIRKVVSEYANNIKFVMFYSVTEGSVTIIPVFDMQLSMDEKFYVEEKLDDLKTWTRRKR